jgi:hypothetical protein
MSRHNATFVDEKQLKFLKEMDKWLFDEPFGFTDEQILLSREVRTLISKVEERGYYYEDEAEFLNLMREEFIRYTKDNKKKRL